MITLIAGLHGDAPEATATLNRLAQTVQTDSIEGTLVIIPWIDRAGHASVADEFPLENASEKTGEPINEHVSEHISKIAGSYANRLTGLITTHFINNASLVVDFQSGGADFGFASSAAIIQQTDRDLQQRAEASMIAFGAPNSVRLPSHYACGLDLACARENTPCVRLLLGGQGTQSADVLDIAWRGCQNLFSQSGLMAQEITLCATRMLELRDDHALIHATQTGLQSSTARLGCEVWRGDVLVHLSDLMALTTPVAPLNVPRDSIVLGMRQSGLCKAGDCLVLLADEVQR